MKILYLVQAEEMGIEGFLDPETNEILHMWDREGGDVRWDDDTFRPFLEKLGYVIHYTIQTKHVKKLIDYYYGVVNE